jgi:hypothetical protein
MADERYFLVKAENSALSRDGWTAEEAQVMADHKWWTWDELEQTSAIIWPDDLLAMLKSAVQ